MFKALTDCITGEPYYVDVVTGKQYRRAVCALAWPWHPLPGCVVTLAEYRNRPTVLGEARHVDVMDETFSASPEELIRAADRSMRAFKVPRLVTPDDDNRLTLIDLENDKRREERKAYLRTEGPISWHGKGEGLLPFYTSLLHARIIDAKTLNFGRKSELPTAVQPVIAAPENIDKAMIKWPAVCALCWALEAIDLQLLPEWGGKDTGMPEGPADAVGGY